MALTITGLKKDVAGNKRLHSGLIAFDSSYPTGGEALAVGDIGLHTIEKFDCLSTTGYVFEYDYTNFKLKAFQAQSVGVVSVNTTAVGNVGGGTDDLMTYVLKGSTLGVNGAILRATAFGTTANNATGKTITAVLGATTIGSIAPTVSIAGHWYAQVLVVRTGAATQKAAWGVTSGATIQADAESVAGTEDLTTDLTFKFTGAAGADNDIVQSAMIIEILAPPGTGGGGVEVPNTVDLSSTTVRFLALGT